MAGMEMLSDREVESLVSCWAAVRGCLRALACSCSGSPTMPTALAWPEGPCLRDASCLFTDRTWSSFAQFSVRRRFRLLSDHSERLASVCETAAERAATGKART